MMSDMKVIFSEGANRILETEPNERAYQILKAAGKRDLQLKAGTRNQSLCIFLHDEVMVGYALVKWECGCAGYRAIPIRNANMDKEKGAFEKLASELFDLVADRRFPSIEVMEIFPKHQGNGLGNFMIMSLLKSSV